MARKLNGRSISIHRSYPAKDIADALRVHKGTVLRWIRNGDLKPIDDGRPILVQGKTLRAYLEWRKPKKQKCATDEWYCLKCREPRHAAFEEGEIVSANRRTCNVRALCCWCATVMHKRFSIPTLSDLTASVRLSAQHHLKHLIE
ncbi:MAG: helix-turn-helix domain-containing protein [Alphaproteobacteria bacterium]|nr:helix-turn-helix domain-containing protein [Alphaproteobacteria bacterium]